MMFRFILEIYFILNTTLKNERLAIGKLPIRPLFHIFRFVDEIDSEIKPANEVEILDTSANEVGDKPAYVQHLGKFHGTHILYSKLSHQTQLRTK